MDNININTQIYDKKVDRVAMVRLFEKKVHSQVEEAIDEHAVNVEKILSKHKTLHDSKKDLDIEQKRAFTKAYQSSKRSLLELAGDQLSFTYQNLEAFVSKIWNTKRPERAILEEIVLKRPLYQDNTLLQGWNNLSTSERKRLEGLIRKEMAEGKTLEEISRDIRKGNVFNITRNQARGLVVTSMTSVTNQVDQAVYSANKELLQGWQYVAVLDSETTPICAARDGKIFPVDDTRHLPPAHFHCRSSTVPVLHSWDDLLKSDNIAQIRKRNLSKLSKDEVSQLDGQTPLRESYHLWLMRQPQSVQLRHLGDYTRVEMFQKGDLHLDKFSTVEGKQVGISELRSLTDDLDVPGESKKFASAKLKLDTMRLPAVTPDDLINDVKLKNTLLDYYLLQASELDGTLSVTNYRGTLIGVKKAVKNRVLNTPPQEHQLLFNPITGQYDDSRVYQPNHAVLGNSLKLVRDSDKLLDRDKEFIFKFNDSLKDRMSVNQRAVVVENLRNVIGRARENKELWGNFKAVTQGQIKFDVMNISDNIETQLRKDTNLLKKLQDQNFIDPVLGPTSIEDLHDNLIPNILERNAWEDKVAPKIAKKLKPLLFNQIPIRINARLTNRDLQTFFLKFTHRLAQADMPDRDQLAVAVGRDLYNLANLNGTKDDWYKLGLGIVESKNVSKFYELETYGVQKRRLKSRLSGSYFGPYYDTVIYNLRITDPDILKYARLNRKIDVGLRVAVTNKENRFVFREGFKTYQIKDKLGVIDTRIPITSTSAFSDFPEDFVDSNLVKALNWASSTEYKIDKDFFDAVNKILYFEDDKGKAAYYNSLNILKKYLTSRGDTYERFKMMEWLSSKDKSFSNHAFIDHRARIYDRGFISPQSGETFRPFLNTVVEKNFSEASFINFQDQIGAFLGGLSDFFEGRFNGLTITGRQKIAAKWRPELIKIGNHMLRGKPNDIRAILENPMVANVDGEELAKFLRFAIEMAKIDKHLGGNFTKKGLVTLSEYKTALALEQDASSSGAQIIALTTKNKQLAELSNVVPTNQKKRLYDEIAAATFRDPRFKKINEKLGLTEKDLRKAAKAQNMVECCHV